MNTNNTLRSLRYTFDLSDSKMIEIFALGGQTVTREQVSQWLKKDDHPDFKLLTDTQLSIFLNGFITKFRGKKDGLVPEPEKFITNNIIIKKIKIALSLQSDDMKDILNLANMTISDHELSAFFRKPDHKNYRECKDQILRCFLKGLQLKHRPKDPIEHDW
ncbi:MAG: DUF1456 family protein [Bdellovibrionales bacterium]|nr:DUF1456 family protein [Bdellovibrionales bacterium]